MHNYSLNCPKMSSGLLEKTRIVRKKCDLYAATLNFEERDRQLNEHRRKLYLSIRDGLDSIVLNKMDQQFRVLSQEETAEVQRRGLQN